MPAREYFHVSPIIFGIKNSEGQRFMILAPTALLKGRDVQTPHVKWI
jgi:hypothetical protein